MTPRIALGCVLLATLSACSKAPPAPPARPPEVTVFTVAAGATELSTDRKSVV